MSRRPVIGVFGEQNGIMAIDVVTIMRDPKSPAAKP
jgi:hypothetical protein